MNVKNKKTYYQLILDKSGSMQDSVDTTVSGFNEQMQMIKTLKKKFPEQEFLVSLTTFNQDVSFDIEQLLLSLLKNEELMSVDNLLFEDGDPLHVPKRRINTVGDVDSGSWYINAHKHLCQKADDVLVPIIFFIDGVTIDMYSHLNIEPVTFTIDKTDE